MKQAPTHIFLDTNVYIIGVAYPESPEAAILSWLGYGQEVIKETTGEFECLTPQDFIKIYSL